MKEQIRPMVEQATENILGVKIVNQDLFADLLLKKCYELIEASTNTKCIYTTFDKSQAECVKREILKFVKSYFND